MHAPLRQTWPALQAVPHLPQLAASDCVSVQPFAHAASPDRHWQAELAQVCPVTQALPQLPQLALLLETSTHAEPHTACPAPHCEPWPPEPPALVVPPPLVAEEQPVGSADPRHNSNSNPNDLFIWLDEGLSEPKSLQRKPSRQRKARPPSSPHLKIDDQVLDVTGSAIRRWGSVDGEREFEPAMGDARAAEGPAVSTGVRVSN